VQKPAAPCRVSVRVESDDRRVEVGVADDGCGVADDGCGGADAHGAALRGLADRIESLGGCLAVASPAGGGTRLGAEIPLGERSVAAHQRTGLPLAGVELPTARTP
jgi:signal transduction histidine kinase